MNDVLKTLRLIICIWLFSVYSYFLGMMFYNGLVNITDYSMNGVILFITGICTIVLLICYPIKHIINEEVEKKKKEKQKREQKEKKQKSQENKTEE